MTSENRTLVELKDVLGVEFECSKCQSKFLYSLSNQHQRLLDKCPNCFEPWFMQSLEIPFNQPSLGDQISSWMNGMRNISLHQGVKAKVRLHITTAEFSPVSRASIGREGA
jgi:hypothetical protein